MDYIVHGILQARILEWVAIPWIKPKSPTLQADSLPAELPGKPKKWKLLSRVQLFAAPWTIQFMEFSRPEY